MATYPQLDPLLHSQLRLAIMSLLMGVEQADFGYIKKQTEASAGNVSVQLNKLKDAGYVKIEKRFEKNYPKTICSVTEDGIAAFQNYVKALRNYL